MGCYPVLSNRKTKVVALAVFQCCYLLSGVVRLARVQGVMVSFSVEEMLYALVSPEEGEKQMRGSLEEGKAAASHKCLVFFVVKSLPLNQSDSHYFSPVIFLSISVLPAASESKLTRTSVSPPLCQPLHLFFFCLFVAVGLFPLKLQIGCCGQVLS